ncbi:MAG: carbonic anhydrase/acetyltransferase-like protein (isoleucine patch superfamily) [Myxococcota bacterium]
MIHRFGEHFPTLGDNVFVADDATIIGRVEIGAQSSVWFQTVIRGDVHWIRIGERSNIQDGCVIHVTTDTHPTIIEDDVTVGHSVTLHGCTLKRGCLIGIGSVVMDEAVIGEGALVAAGSLVTPRTLIPPHTLAVGSPAKPKRLLTEAERADVADHADRYVTLAARYLNGDAEPVTP